MDCGDYSVLMFRSPFIRRKSASANLLIIIGIDKQTTDKVSYIMFHARLSPETIPVKTRRPPYPVMHMCAQGIWRTVFSYMAATQPVTPRLVAIAVRIDTIV